MQGDEKHVRKLNKDKKIKVSTKNCETNDFQKMPNPMNINCETCPFDNKNKAVEDFHVQQFLS